MKTNNTDQDQYEVQRLIEKSKYSEAITKLELAIKNNPRNFSAWKSMAECVVALGNQGLALETIEQGARITDHMDGWLFAADAFEKQKKLDRAEGLYLRAHALKTDSVKTALALSDFYIRNNKNHDALDFLLEETKKNSNDAELAFRLQEVAMKTGNEALAKPYVDPFLLRNDHSELVLNAALSAASRRRFSDALSFTENHDRKFGNNANAMFVKANIAWLSGDALNTAKFSATARSLGANVQIIGAKSTCIAQKKKRTQKLA